MTTSAARCTNKATLIGGGGYGAGVWTVCAEHAADVASEHVVLRTIKENEGALQTAVGVELRRDICQWDPAKHASARTSTELVKPCPLCDAHAITFADGARVYCSADADVCLLGNVDNNLSFLLWQALPRRMSEKDALVLVEAHDDAVAAYTDGYIGGTAQRKKASAVLLAALTGREPKP